MFVIAEASFSVKIAGECSIALCRESVGLPIRCVLIVPAVPLTHFLRRAIWFLLFGRGNKELLVQQFVQCEIFDETYGAWVLGCLGLSFMVIVREW